MAVSTSPSPEKASSPEKRVRSRSRSRSRKRRPRGHRKSHRHSRHRRSRSHSRRHHDGRGGRRRSRSRSHSRSRRHRRRRSSSRGRHRRRRSHSRSRRRHRSRSPGSEDKKRGGGFPRHSRSRSREAARRDNVPRRRSSCSPRNGSLSAPAEKKTFKDQMREQFMQAGMALGAASLMRGVDIPEDSGKPVSTSELVSEAAALNLLPNMSEDELLKLASKNPQVARVLLMRSRAEALTGVTVPKYYSLSAVNPLKYAEQMQKRKMLWSRTKDTQQKNEALWTASSAAVAGSGEEAVRFRKLMGIKDVKTNDTGKDSAQAVTKQSSHEAASVAKKQEELFRNLDKEYEFARNATHSARGVGLGYSNQAFIDPNQFQR